MNKNQPKLGHRGKMEKGGIGRRAGGDVPGMQGGDEVGRVGGERARGEQELGGASGDGCRVRRGGEEGCTEDGVPHWLGTSR